MSRKEVATPQENPKKQNNEAEGEKMNLVQQ